MARVPASFGGRLACLLYDGMLVTGVVLAAALPFVGLTHRLDPDWTRPLLQVYVVAVVGGYFTLFWRKGQTLGMKTWGVELVAHDGGRPGWGRLWLRFALAVLNLALLGVGWWSALWHPQRQFLQDRIAGTRLVKALPRRHP